MENIPNETIVSSTEPYFTSTLNGELSQQLLPALTILEPGMTYVWRVTASDPSGAIQFSRGGKSECRSFQYLYRCGVPGNVTVEMKGTQANFQWAQGDHNESYNVELDRIDEDNNFNKQAFVNEFPYFDIPRGSKWRVRVSGECSYTEPSAYTQWTEFDVPPAAPEPTIEECPDCGCGKSVEEKEIKNFTLRKDVEIGDTIVNKTGRTKYVIRTVTANGDDSYKGTFNLLVPLWGTYFICEYENLKVNTDNVIVGGTWHSIEDDLLLGDPEAVAARIAEYETNIAQATYNNHIRETVTVDRNIESIYRNEDGRYIAVTEEGTEEDITYLVGDKKRVLVTAKNGEEFVIVGGDSQPMGKAEYKAAGSNSTMLDMLNKEKNRGVSGAVTFTPYEEQKYGFDAYDGEHGISMYEVVGSGYRVPYKSVEAYSQDKVRVDGANGITTFKDHYGMPVVRDENVLKLQGKGDGDESNIYAYGDATQEEEQGTVLGRMTLLSYAKRTVNVKVVTINNAKAPVFSELEREINAIFKPAVVEVKVEDGGDISGMPYSDGVQFVHGGSGLLTPYSEDEKRCIAQYEQQHDKAEGETYVLFYVDKAKKLDSEGRAYMTGGYMPIGYHYGFIFDSPTAKFVAHEIAHGAFTLRHPFEMGEQYLGAEGTTNNLMDYAGGTALHHKQWHLAHNPDKNVFKFLQDEEGGEWTTDGHYYLFTYIGMLMGMDYATAEQYGRWAEEPDSHVISKEDIENGGQVRMGDTDVTIDKNRLEVGNMVENTTWMIGGLQQRNHALTGGFHGVELLMTTWAIKYDYEMGSNSKEYLFHRFGDCFAHFDVSNDSNGFNDVPLQSYLDSVDNFLTNNVFYDCIPGVEWEFSDGKKRKVLEGDIYIDAADNAETKIITTYSRQAIAEEICRSIIFAQNISKVKQIESGHSHSVIRYYTGLQPYIPLQPYISLEPYSSYDELCAIIKGILPKARQNTYKMYGKNVNGCIAFTLGHTTDGSKPDQIVSRPALFKLYAQKVAELLDILGKVDNSKREYALKQLYSVVDWAVSTGEKEMRLDGIWALNICLLKAQMEGKKCKTLTFKIPIKWLPDELQEIKTVTYYITIGNFTLLELKGEKDARNQMFWLVDYFKTNIGNVINAEKITLKTLENSNYVSIEIRLVE